MFKIGDEPVKIRRDEVKKYVEDQTFCTILAYYNWIKLWGMPYGTGWAELPVDVLDGITALEIEAKAMEAEQYAELDKKRVNNTNTPKGIKRKQ